MSPGMTSMPQCWYDDKLDSVRKPIDRRPGLLAVVQTVGEDARICCNQSRFVETWVISTRKSFVEGSISTSEYGKAAWHASGSVKQRTLLQATLSFPRGGKSVVARKRRKAINQSKRKALAFGARR